MMVAEMKNDSFLLSFAARLARLPPACCPLLSRRSIAAIDVSPARPARCWQVFIPIGAWTSRGGQMDVKLKIGVKL